MVTLLGHAAGWCSGRHCVEHPEQDGAKFFVFVAVDEKVAAGVDCHRQMRQADQTVHKLGKASHHDVRVYNSIDKNMDFLTDTLL